MAGGRMENFASNVAIEKICQVLDWPGQKARILPAQLVRIPICGSGQKKKSFVFEQNQINKLNYSRTAMATADVRCSFGRSIWSFGSLWPELRY